MRTKKEIPVSGYYMEGVSKTIIPDIILKQDIKITIRQTGQNKK
jgi:hypothetical protein